MDEDSSGNQRCEKKVLTQLVKFIPYYNPNYQRQSKIFVFSGLQQVGGIKI